MMAFFRKTREKIKNNVKATAKEHKDRFVVPGRMLVSQFKRISKQRKEPNPKNFNELLTGWQITEEMIPAILKSLWLRCLIFIMTLIIVGGLLLAQGFIFTTLLIMPPIFIGLMTSFWRMSLLKNREYISFRDWFMSPAKKKPKMEVGMSSDEAEAGSEILRAGEGNRPEASNEAPETRSAEGDQ